MSTPIKTPCYCPNKPHENDEFTLAEELPMGAGLAAAVAGAAGGGVEVMVPAMLRNGAIVRWNLVDEEGKELPITAETVDGRLTWATAKEFLNEALPRLVSGLSGVPLGSAPSPKKTERSSRNGLTAA